MNEIKEKFNNVIDSGGINEIYIGPEEKASEEAKINVAPNEKGYDELKYRNPETRELKNIYLEPTGDTLPIGFVGAYSGTTAPTNWLICDGSEISRTTYSELFNVIGTTYGEGDGSTTFNLPDLKGKVITGLDSEDTDFSTIGLNGGSKYLQEHTHSKLMQFYTQVDGSAGIINALHYSGSPYSETKEIGAGNVSNIETGDSGNLQPYIVQNYIIKAKNSVGLVGNVTNEYSESKQDSYGCDFINGTVLYDNEEGTTEDVTLSETSANFRYLEIYFHSDASNYASVKVDEPNGKIVSLVAYNASGTTLVLYDKKVTINENTITVNNGLVSVITSSISNEAGLTYILIDKVVGHK